MILNLTQHPASQEQIEAGVIEPTKKEYVKELLTFNELPTKQQIKEKAKKIAVYASFVFRNTKDFKDRKAMIGGAPYLMSQLEEQLRRYRIEPIYAFSQRVSEEKEIDGKIVKTNVFKHIGFVSTYKK